MDLVCIKNGNSHLRVMSMLALAVIVLLTGAPAGILVSATNGHCGLVTDPACWTLNTSCRAVVNRSVENCIPPQAKADFAEPDCVNNGVIVMTTVVGHNDYCTGGSCGGEGVFVAVGQTSSCRGPGFLMICKADDCVVTVI